MLPALHRFELQQATLLFVSPKLDDMAVQVSIPGVTPTQPALIIVLSVDVKLLLCRNKKKHFNYIHECCTINYKGERLCFLGRHSL